MKFQYLAVIFVIIILPITLVLSFYAQTQIDIINEQTMYTTKLNNATSSAVMAFQINTTNSHYSSISDSKIRDIEASVNTFYNSLTADLNYTKDELKAYVPAIVYTLYDGYYIYGKRVNAYQNLEYEKIINNGSSETEKTGDLKSMDILTGEELENTTKYEYGLKPFVYYSCRYTGENGNDFVVNYTLDNFISIYGNVYDKEKGKLEYVTESGYLINPNNLNGTAYKGASISSSEILKEYVKFNNGESKIDESLTIRDGEYQYIIYKNQKIYISGNNYFWYDRGDAILVNSEDTKSYISSHKNSTDALDYYKSASKFSNWVNKNLGSINKSNNVKSYNDGKNLKYDTGKEPIFNMTNQDPEDPSSTFNQHRMAVIRAAIETNLIAAINSYNSNASSYAYALPQLEEEEWENVTNNVCMISFMQGLPMGGKYFNNYVVIPNDKNNEFVDTDSVYLLGDDGCYHMPNCPELVNGSIKVTNIYEDGYGYINTSFERQTIVKENDEQYYYKHVIRGQVNNAYTGCYHCIVEPSSKYNLQTDIIDNTKNEITKDNKTYDITELRKIYLTVLAREKYNLYKTNN